MKLTPGHPSPTMAVLSGSSTWGEKPSLPQGALLIKDPQVAEPPVASLPEQVGIVLVTRNAVVDLQCALLQVVREGEQKEADCVGMRQAAVYVHGYVPGLC